jgi:Tol biopolymer transport system component
MAKRPLVSLALPLVLLTACAVGDPRPATYVTDISASLNGDAYSSIEGELTYRFRYGETSSYGTETPRRTIDNIETVAHPVSEPIRGLKAGTTYHWQMCVQDAEEEPPRDICSKDQTFTTSAVAGRSGIAYVSSQFGSNNWEIFRMDLDGSDPINISKSPGKDEDPTWSPDGRRIAFVSDRDGNSEIYVMNADGSNSASQATRLTNTLGGEHQPAWSPDGTKIAFYWDSDERYEEIYVMNADGSDRVRLTNQTGSDFYPAWSRDGRRIGWTKSNGTPPIDFAIWAMDSNGAHPVRVTNGPDSQSSPEWTYDGRQIMFQSESINLVEATGGPFTEWAPARGFAGLTSDGAHAGLVEYTGSEFEIVRIGQGGTDKTYLTNNSWDDVNPVWSPRP